jgi:REP element-mobilizing transposase RayT
MARPPRVVVPNGVYHVTARGNRGQPLFSDDQDYQRYLRLLEETASRHGWLCLSYRLTADRVQLVVRTPVPNLSEGMQRLQSRYAQWFNRRHGFSGHLFAGRFRSTLVGAIDDLLEPLRRGSGDGSRFRAGAARGRVAQYLSVDVTLRLSRAERRSTRPRVLRILDSFARPPP